jgi:aspartate/methionine/tyrosine aminotransferase
VTLHEPDWSIDEAELRAAFNQRARAIIINTPHNPTGKVFTRAGLDLVAELAQRWDAYVLTDGIYEHNPTFPWMRRISADGYRR